MLSQMFLQVHKKRSCARFRDCKHCNILKKDEGIIIDEPTLSRNKITEQIDKVGSDAKKIAGKEPNYITIERPLKNGIISEYDSTFLGLLDIFFSKLKDQNKTNIRIIVSSPSGVTKLRKIVFQCCS